jgi:hypothetical protein
VALIKSLIMRDRVDVLEAQFQKIGLNLSADTIFTKIKQNDIFLTMS